MIFGGVLGPSDFQMHSPGPFRMFSSQIDLSNDVSSTPNGDRMQNLCP
jgi:hypothetical protein